MFRRQASAWLRVLKCRRGAAMVEYALLAGLVALVATTSVTSFGTSVRSKFQAVVAVL